MKVLVRDAEHGDREVHLDSDSVDYPTILLDGNTRLKMKNGTVIVVIERKGEIMELFGCKDDDFRYEVVETSESRDEPLPLGSPDIGGPGERPDINSTEAAPEHLLDDDLLAELRAKEANGGWSQNEQGEFEHTAEDGTVTPAGNVGLPPTTVPDVEVNAAVSQEFKDSMSREPEPGENPGGESECIQPTEGPLLTELSFLDLRKYAKSSGVKANGTRQEILLRLGVEI